MAILTQLDVINDMLASLGEAPLNSLEDDHPMVASGVRQLRVVSNREQAKGWWFNKELVTLSPDPTDGSIYAPADTISLDPLDPANAAVLRGRRLYNPVASSNPYQFTSDVTCVLTRYIEFTDLPPTAAVYIAQSAVLAFQKSYDADPTKTKQLMSELREAYIALNAEHIRNMKVNLLTKPATLAKFNELGYSPGLGGVYR